MAYRRANIPDIGELVLVKRRGAKNIRLSITAKGEIRVSLPSWAPYAVGIAFARDRSAWINQQKQLHAPQLIQPNAQIGKSHRVVFKVGIPGQNLKIRTKGQAIEVQTDLPHTNSTVQSRLKKAAEEALRAESEHLLPQRLKTLAAKFGFTYRSVTVRKLSSRWGSCSTKGDIKLSFYLMQLPWQLIDYVLLHELIHTKHLHHGAQFWEEFNRVLPEAKQYRKQIRSYKPQILPLDP